MTSKNHLLVAVDFDGTCVLHKYPQVGTDVPHAERVIKRLVEEAGARIILYTMRSNDGPDGNCLEQAVEWFNEKGIRLYGVNQNPTQHRWTSSPKVYAQMYIDDAAVGCPLAETGWPEDRPYVDWQAVERSLESRGILKR